MADHARPTADEIITLEKSYWEAMLAKDGKRAARLSGAISLVTGPRHVRTIPKDRMASMTEAGDWTLHEYAFDDVQVVIPAANVAIIGYRVRQKVTMNGKAMVLHAVDSSTWVRGADGWECHGHSEALLDDRKNG